MEISLTGELRTSDLPDFCPHFFSILFSGSYALLMFKALTMDSPFLSQNYLSFKSLSYEITHLQEFVKWNIHNYFLEIPVRVKSKT